MKNHKAAASHQLSASEKAIFGSRARNSKFLTRQLGGIRNLASLINISAVALNRVTDGTLNYSMDSRMAAKICHLLNVESNWLDTARSEEELIEVADAYKAEPQLVDSEGDLEIAKNRAANAKGIAKVLGGTPYLSQVLGMSTVQLLKVFDAKSEFFMNGKFIKKMTSIFALKEGWMDSPHTEMEHKAVVRDSREIVIN